MPPTKQHLATLDKFDRWTRTLFGKASPCFSSKHHVLPGGSVEINRGGMRLVFGNMGGITLYDYSQGCQMVVMSSGDGLERTLMAGLTWAIQRKFHETYPS